jgi:hypothetical protein
VDKNKNIIILLVVVAVGVVGFLLGRNLLFYMKLDERVKALDRFITAEAILALPDQVKQDAEHYKVPVDTLKTELMIEGRVVQGDMIFYWLVLTVHNGSHDYKFENRLESQASLLQADTRKRLEDAGVKFKGCG